MSYRLLVKKVVSLFVNVCSSTTISASSYLQVSAALTGTVEAIQVSNGTTSTIALASGAAGHEVKQVVVGPGMSPIIPVESLFPKGARVSATAVDSDATSGTFAVNFLSG